MRTFARDLNASSSRISKSSGVKTAEMCNFCTIFERNGTLGLKTVTLSSEMSRNDAGKVGLSDRPEWRRMDAHEEQQTVRADFYLLFCCGFLAWKD